MATTYRKPGEVRGRKMGYRHQEDVRSKIRASQLLNYLNRLAIENQGSENSATRVKAASTLLNKVLPDLARTEHTGEGGGPLELVHRVE